MGFSLGKVRNDECDGGRPPLARVGVYQGRARSRPGSKGESERAADPVQIEGDELAVMAIGHQQGLEFWVHGETLDALDAQAPEVHQRLQLIQTSVLIRRL